jgi:hypothetical protein
MKPTFLFLIAICMTVFAVQSCKKTPPPEPDNPWGLPNATQEGKNIFACRVNGENWISEKGIRKIGGEGVSNERIYVSGNLSEGELSFERFVINIYDNVNKEEIFLFNDTILRYVEYSTLNNDCFYKNGGYGTSRAKSYEGKLTLTKFDTINKILSGTFWFNINTDYCDTMKVTDGRFDINYY